MRQNSKLGRDTSHSVEVAVKRGDMPGCNKMEACGLWGSGAVRFSNSEGATDYRAAVILTFAGCEKCSDTNVTQDDLGIITTITGDIHTTRRESTEQVVERAKIAIAEVVQTFAPAPE